MLKEYDYDRYVRVRWAWRALAIVAGLLAISAPVAAMELSAPDDIAVSAETTIPVTIGSVTPVELPVGSFVLQGPSREADVVGWSQQAASPFTTDPQGRPTACKALPDGQLTPSSFGPGTYSYVPAIPTYAQEDECTLDAIIRLAPG